jgi:hypothetical protein
MVAAISNCKDLDEGIINIEVTLFIVSPWVWHNLSLNHHQKAQKGNIGIALLILYLGAEWGWMVYFSLRKEPQGPLHSRLSGLQGQC